MSNVAAKTSEAENGAVRAMMRKTAVRWTGWAAAVLCVSLSGLAQSQDREPNKTLQGKTPQGNATQTSASAPAPEARVDINVATMDELLKVPGLARPWAERIVRFRPYRTKADLKEKGIVTSEVYERIKDYVIAHREKQ
ncbi:MAG: helix-hairpin-helix domain-containing protein [Terracidiphilus sp.]